jgi:hypothetical protein
MRFAFLFLIFSLTLITHPLFGQHRRLISKALFVGNSITLHPPNASIGWPGSWGMAATSGDKDYVHLTVNTIARTQGSTSVPIIANRPAFEREFMHLDIPVYFSFMDTLDPDLVVFQLGDNTNLDSALHYDFQAAYLLMINTTKTKCPNADIIALTTFWGKPLIDSMITEASLAAGAKCRYIGWIGADTLNRAGWERTVSDPGVAIHPGDRGMEKISRVVIEAATTGVIEEESTLPETQSLRVYPNPFNGTTIIRFGQMRRGEVEIRLFSVLGEQVFARSLGEMEAGIHDAPIDARSLGSGSYWIMVSIGPSRLYGRALLIR